MMTPKADITDGTEPKVQYKQARHDRSAAQQTGHDDHKRKSKHEKIAD